MKNAITIGGLTVNPGELKLGQLTVGYLPDSSAVNIPLIVMNGAEDGPTLLLDACMHGNEITGIEVIRRLTREIIDPKTLRGAIVAAPIINPFCFNHDTMNTPQDGLNINRCFPGEKGSLLSFQVADIVYRELAKKCDYIIDFHANAEPAMEFSIIKEGRDKKAWETARRMAEAFGITTVEMVSSYESHRAGTMVEAAGNDGVPCMIIELISWRRQTASSVVTGVRGTMNVMKMIGMIDGELEEQTTLKIDAGCRFTRQELHANRGGIVQWNKELGEAIKKDEVIAVVRDPWGDIVEELKSPGDGWILAWPFLGNQSVPTGDIIVMIVFPKGE